MTSLYDPLFSNWCADSQPEGPSHISPYKFTAKVIQTALFAGTFAKYLSNFAAYFPYLTKTNTAFGPALLLEGGLCIFSWQVLYLACQICLLIERGLELYNGYENRSHQQGESLCCKLKLADVLFGQHRIITSIALCALGGFNGAAVAMGLEAALLANAHFWRWQNHRFFQHNTSCLPSQPTNNALVSDVHSQKIGLRNLNSASLSTSINGFARIHNSLIDLRYSEVNTDLLSSLVQKLDPDHISSSLFDLRGCDKISIDELSEILKKWPQLHIRVGVPFSFEDIYSLQTWNPQVHIEYDTRFEEMAKLFEEEIDTDVIFQLGTSQIKAHSFIFAAFYNDHPLPTKPVPISGISEEDFKSLLKKIYLGMLSSREHAQLKESAPQLDNGIFKSSYLFEGTYSPDYLETLFSFQAQVSNGVTVHTKERSHSLHPAILKARNPYFKTAIDYSTCNITNTPPTLDLTTLGDLGLALLQYAYTNIFPFTKITPEQFEALSPYIDFTDLRRLAELAYYQFLATERRLSKSFDCLPSLVSAVRSFHKAWVPICTAKIAHRIKDKWGISLSPSEEDGENLDLLIIHKVSDFSNDIQELKGIKEIILEIQKDGAHDFDKEWRMEIYLKNLIHNQTSLPILRLRSPIYFGEAEDYFSIAKIKEITLHFANFKKKEDVKKLEIFIKKQRNHLEKIVILNGIFKEEYLEIFKKLDRKKTNVIMSEKVSVIYKPSMPLHSRHSSYTEDFEKLQST